MAYGTNSNGGYSGTIIASPIRPADPLQTIATVFSNEVKGSLHTYPNITERDALIEERRDWGMLCYVVDQNKTYQLTYGYSSTASVTDNLNWKEFSGSGGGSGEWVDSVLSVSFSEPVSPNDGDRYLVGRKPTDTVTGTNWGVYTPGFIAQYNTSLLSWEFTFPTDNMSVRVDDEENSIYRYEGVYGSTGAWQKEKENQIRNVSAILSSGGDYSATVEPVLAFYDIDSLYVVNFDSSNIGASVSLDINGLGPVIVKKTDGSLLSDIISSEISTNYQYLVTYDGTYFQLLNPSSSVGGSGLNIKYNVITSDNIVVPPNTQYWVYGDLTLDGTIDNLGHVIVTNGNLTLGPSGSFNVGTYSNVYFAEINGLGQTNNVPRWVSPYMLTATSSIYDDGNAVEISGTTFSVNADFVIPTGASAGYVLTSDASGVGTWQTINHVYKYSATMSLLPSVFYPVTHGLNTPGIVVDCWDENTGDQIIISIKRTSDNAIDILSSSTQSNARIVVIG